jgi:hypothetical protein
MSRSKHERAQRAEETERARAIEAAWRASLDPEVAASFAREVEAANARGPLSPPPDMAPGTRPNPPRPGHEPKPPKDAGRSRRRAF